MRVPSTLGLLFLLACSCSHEDPQSTTPEVDPADAESGRRAMAFQLALRTELGQALKSGGPAAAVEVCSQRAAAIATAASSEKFTVRRVGTRLRNAANSPTARDQRALETLAARPKGDDSPLRFDTEDDLVSSLYVPIRIAETCLQCHGDPVAIPDDVRQALAQRYPSDRATGYALGDLRGAVVVDHRR